VAIADDTAPIDLATGRRLDPHASLSEPDAPLKRKHDTSNALALALIDRFDSLIRANMHAGIPPEAKEALAAEAVRMVERAWTARGEERASETQTAMRLSPDHQPRPSAGSRAWPVVAAVLGFVLLLGAGAFATTVLAMRYDELRTRYGELVHEAEERDVKIVELAAGAAEDAAYNRVVANWLVTHIETSNANARNLDSMMRAIAGRVKADVSAIEPPTKEYLPTAVNRLSAAHEYLDAE